MCCTSLIVILCPLYRMVPSQRSATIPMVGLCMLLCEYMLHVLHVCSAGVGSVELSRESFETTGGVSSTHTDM